MFTTILFTIAKRQKLKCPSKDEWINKMWHTTDDYSAIPTITWMTLEKCYTKSKRSDTKGYILHDSIYMKYPEQANPEKIDLWLPGAGKRGKWGVTA